MSNDATSLIHPTYRHLERPIRLAGLTLWQWAQCTAAALTAWLLAHVLPVASPYDVSIAVTVAGIPAAASLAAMGETTHPIAHARARVMWKRRARLHPPADAETATATGYRLTDDR